MVLANAFTFYLLLNLLFSLHYPFLDIFWCRQILYSLIQTATMLHTNMFFNKQGMRRKRTAINPTKHVCASVLGEKILGWEISIADLAIMRRVIVIRTDIIFISLIIRLFINWIQMGLKVIFSFYTNILVQS